jgi:AcrR family transcriptional regulator
MNDTGSVLPRGPHALPQEVVLAHQRERLLGATPEVLAERGFAELTVRDLIGRAGVSRRTFYQLFDDKLECVLLAHEMALTRLSDTIGEACSPKLSWPENVAAAVGRALELATEAPNEVRLAMLAGHGVLEPKLMGPALAAQERLASFLRVGRKRSGEIRVPGELTEPAVIGAVTAIVSARLGAGEVEGLQQLAPELVQIILAPYLGYDVAERFAEAAAA